MTYHWAKGSVVNGKNVVWLADIPGLSFATRKVGSCIYNGAAVFVPIKSIGNNNKTALVELDGERLTLYIEDLFYTSKIDPVLMDLIPFRELDMGELEMSKPTAENVRYETGAQRSGDVEMFRYDLLHPIFMKRVASVMAEGAEKYGAHNWEQGFPMDSLFNHLIAHLMDYLSGDRNEDHLGHAACNIMFLIVESEMRYEKHAHLLRDPGCQLSDAMKKNIEEWRQAKAKAKNATCKEEVCCKADSIPEIVLRIRKMIEGGEYARQEKGGCSLSLLKNELRHNSDGKSFEDYDIVNALQSEGFGYYDNQVAGLVKVPVATPPVQENLLDCGSEIQSLFQKGTLVKARHTSVNLKAVKQHLIGTYTDSTIEKTLKEFSPDCHVYEKAGAFIVAGISVNPNSKVELQPQIDSVRAKVLSMFVSGELRYWGGARLKLSTLVRHVGQDDPQTWHAFNTIGFRIDGDYLIDMEWKPK